MHNRRLLFLVIVIFLSIGCILAVPHHEICWGQDLSLFSPYLVPPINPEYPTLWSHTYLPSSYIPGFNSLTDRARYVYFTWPGFSVLNSFGLSGIELAYSYMFPLNMTYGGYYLFPQWKVPDAVPPALAQWPLYAIPPNLWFGLQFYSGLPLDPQLPLRAQSKEFGHPHVALPDR